MTAKHLKYNFDNISDNYFVVTDRKHRVFGWFFDESVNDVAQGAEVFLQGAKCSADVSSTFLISRNDVSVAFNNEEISFCGFMVDFSKIKDRKFEVELKFRMNKNSNLQNSIKFKVKKRSHFKLVNLILRLMKNPKKILDVRNYRKVLKKIAALFRKYFSIKKVCKKYYKLFRKYLSTKKVCKKYYKLFRKYHSTKKVRKKSFNEILGRIDKKYQISTDIIKTSKAVDIVLPIYNGIDYLIPLIESVIRNTTIPYRIIAVNDCSPDPQIREYLYNITKSNDNIMLVDNEINLGFIGSVNKAVTFCKNDFVILNTDTELPRGWLERLIGPIKRDRKIASVTPFSNAATICSFPEIVKDNEIFESMSVDQLDLFFRMIDPKMVVDVPTGIGFCMAVNYNVVKKIGMFDTAFGKGYGEENDWCLRAKAKGYRNVMLPGLFVYHKHGGSFNSLEKQKLIEKNIKIINGKYPSYSASVSDFINSDPLLEIRTIIEFAVLNRNRECFLIFDNDLIGGSDLYRQKYETGLLTEGKIVLLVKYNRDKDMFSMEFISESKRIQNFLFKEMSVIDKIAGVIKIKNAVINNLITYPDLLPFLNGMRELKRKFGIRITMMIHDYYSVCPCYTLVGVQKKYCDLPETSACCDCFRKNERVSLSQRKIGIIKWRRAWSNFLSTCDEIICFSNSSRSIISKAYPCIDMEVVKVIPHKVKDIRKAVKGKKTSKTINIGIIGAIYEDKGLRIVEEMALLAEANKNINIIIIGYTSHPVSGVKITGPYDRNDLVSLVEDNDVDVIFIPSICPETYSYTTDEAMMMGLPVAVFNIGAPAERVRKYSKGLIISRMDAFTALNEIISFADKVNR